MQRPLRAQRPERPIGAPRPAVLHQQLERRPRVHLGLAVPRLKRCRTEAGGALNEVPEPVRVAWGAQFQAREVVAEFEQKDRAVGFNVPAAKLLARDGNLGEVHRRRQILEPGALQVGHRRALLVQLVARVDDVYALVIGADQCLPRQRVRVGAVVHGHEEALVDQARRLLHERRLPGAEHQLQVHGRPRRRRVAVVDVGRPLPQLRRCGQPRRVALHPAVQLAAPPGG
mmetsp:Transcript_72845/g.223022  ORF Transcript_72845/g.223022 Transcript_72845/m.223022 type:complete len:229 (+) Transcript_72845:558-1244(+)